jgi:hypothetical protein
VEARAARDAAQRTLEAAEAAQVAQRAEFDAAAAVTEARRALGLAEEAEAWAAAVALPIERRPEAVAAVEAFQRRHPQPRSEPRPDPRARLRVLGALPDALVLVEVSVAIAPEAAPPSEAAVPTPAQRAAWRQTIAADTPALHDPTVDGRSRRLVDLVVATAEEALATHDETRTRRLQHALQISRSCDCARDLADEGAARVSAVQARLHDALGNTHAARLAWGQLLARHPDDPEARTRRWARSRTPAWRPAAKFTPSTGRGRTSCSPMPGGTRAGGPRRWARAFATSSASSIARGAPKPRPWGAWPKPAWPDSTACRRPDVRAGRTSRAHALRPGIVFARRRVQAPLGFDGTQPEEVWRWPLRVVGLA